MFVSTLTNFNWKCKHTWKKSAHNTKWCLIGCAIGDLGTIFYFQVNEIAWPTLNIMIFAIINGLITSIILETIILLRQNFSLRQAISCSWNEFYIYDINGNSYECYRCNFNGRGNAYLVGRSYNAFCWFYYSLAL